MMYSIGIDMTTISRIRKSLEKGSFATHVFSERELEMFFSEQKPAYRSLAANFAAKEALGKALGTGVRGFSLNEVSVLRNEAGMPYFEFSGRAADIMLKGGYNATVSLSHEGDSAIAVVLLEEGPKVKPLKAL
jgi:holo-[acyl-carrier protein] synthase